jgi:Phospholipase B/Peptidase family M1 domain/Carbohydrate binding domain
MRNLIATLFIPALLAAAPAALFNSTSDTSWKDWSVVSGAAQSDPAVRHDGRASLRVESAGVSGACVQSIPVTLQIGKTYELTGWVRTADLRVRDLERSPIAVGAALSMESMPYDMHSDSVAGTHDWTRLTLRFMATRSQDEIVMRIAEGGAFTGKAWFEGVSIDQASTAGEWPVRAAVKTFGPAYAYPEGGWIYLHIEGKPYDRGYQHGYLLSHEIVSYMDRCAAELDPTAASRQTAWQSARTASNALFLRSYNKELLEEMKGIADGADAAGAKWNGRPVDLVDIVTVNSMTELEMLRDAMPMTPTGLEGLGFQPPSYALTKMQRESRDHCSAFAATGKCTRDGHMVMAHTTWWSLTLSEQTNIMLDIQPDQGHRVLMQSYPGGIESGTDWYQNDAGIVITETTIDQSPFNRAGTAEAFRARMAAQYADSIDKAVALLGTDNNGLYTNEWLIGDAKTDEIAMYELGTYKTRLYRSSKNQWFGGTDGFYWGCNNAKDLQVRLEYAPDPKGAPQSLTFSPAPRDLAWQKLYEKYKGRIDEHFAFLAFRTAPLVSNAAIDAKVTTGAMAKNMMLWAEWGKPNQRETLASVRGRGYEGNDGLFPSGYRLVSAAPSEELRAEVSENERDRLAGKPVADADANANAKQAVEAANARHKHGEETQADARLWRGWILPASDADLWLTSGSATYYRMLASHDKNALAAEKAAYRAAALDGDIPLAQIHSDPASDLWARIARSKGALLLDALHTQMGDDHFYAFMKSYFGANTTKTVTTASFEEAAAKAAGKPLDAFFQQWLTNTGLPGDTGGPIYDASAIYRHLSSAMIVYGTMMDAGANRYAAEQLQQHFLNAYENEVPILKDFELTDQDLRTHDVVFVGRPESNSALAQWISRYPVTFDGASFRVDGKEHASEYSGMMLAGTNPLNDKHMVLVVAGNSALQTVKMAEGMPHEGEYTVYINGKPTDSGFLAR